MGLIKRLFCEHEWEFDRNIYGDEINAAGGRRSWWRCPKCGAYRLDAHLYLELEDTRTEASER